MTKKQLREYRDLVTEKKDLEQKIENLEAVLYATRSQKLDGMPRGGSGESYVIEENIDEKTELLELYQEAKTKIDKQILTVEKAIQALDSRGRQLIRLYYMEGLTWENVAVRMGYSWSQIHRIHRDALAVLREEEETKGWDTES